MFRRVFPLSQVIAVCLLLLDGPPAIGNEASPEKSNYQIRPSSVVAPKGVPFGRYRRTITPFENWTLICDENLQVRERVCNVTQIIEDMQGQMLLSWSLAATDGGKPFMILRTLPQADLNSHISMSFLGRKRPINIQFEGCNQNVCVGMVPVGSIIREQIENAASPSISYPTTTGENIFVTAPMKGLKKALFAIE